MLTQMDERKCTTNVRRLEDSASNKKLMVFLHNAVTNS